LLDLLSELHTFDIPDGMIQMEFKNIWDQLLEEIKKDETRESPELSSEEEAKLKVEYEKIAQRRVRLGLLLSEVGKAQNVVVNAKEVSQSLMQIASRFPGQEKEIESFYKKHPEALAGIRAPIFEEKVVDVLISTMKVIIKEVTEEQLLEELNSPLLGDDEPKTEIKPKKEKVLSVESQEKSEKKTKAKKA
jgi:trigger factor